MRYSYWLSILIGFMSVYTVSPASSDDKIPFTTSSPKARGLFLQGLEQVDLLHEHVAIPLLEKAVAEDPDFAMAYLMIAAYHPTPKLRYANLDKALALVSKVSEGEKLWILAVDAGFKDKQAKQRQYYQQLVKLYPKDARSYALLGDVYYSEQEYATAIEQYNLAITANPNFAPVYNSLGYSYWSVDNFQAAREAFEKYIKLNPNDPNPYDSYAELMLKMGKFNASIKSYRDALSKDPDFLFSYIGVATNLNLKGLHDEARQNLTEMLHKAGNEGEKRQAYFAMAISYADEGKLDKALEMLQQRFQIAKSMSDEVAMAQDLEAVGDLLLEMSRPDEALTKYTEAVKTVERGGVEAEMVAIRKRRFLYNSARVAIAKKEFEGARNYAVQYRTQAEAEDSPALRKTANELDALIELAAGNYLPALQKLAKADIKNPYNIYRMALAQKGKGDAVKAKELCEKAANFNAVNDLNFALIRQKALQLAQTM